MYAACPVRTDTSECQVVLQLPGVVERPTSATLIVPYLAPLYILPSRAQLAEKCSVDFLHDMRNPCIIITCCVQLTLDVAEHKEISIKAFSHPNPCKPVCQPKASCVRALQRALFEVHRRLLEGDYSMTSGSTAPVITRFLVNQPQANHLLQRYLSQQRLTTNMIPTCALQGK